MQTYQGARQLDALGDPSRRLIVMLLSEHGPQSVKHLAGQVPISRPAVSQHLKVLKLAGLVKDRQEGTSHIYALDDAGLADIQGFFSTFWKRDLEDFAVFVRSSIGDGK